MIVSGYDYSVSATREDVFDASVGYDIGFVAYNFMKEHTLRGKYSAASGPGSATPGAAVTIASAGSTNGITTGGIYCTSVGASHAEKGFRDLTVAALQKPGIS